MQARRLALAVVLAGAALAAPGCASMSAKVAESATPVAVDKTLDGLLSPQNQDKIRRLLGDPAIAEASRELAEGLTAGVLAGLSDEERVAHVQRLTERFLERVSEVAAESIREDLTPALEHLLRVNVAAAIDTALAPENRRRLDAAAAGITRQVVTTLVQGTSAGIRDDLGPALAATLERDLSPALARALRSDLAPALEETLTQRLAPALARALDQELRPVLLGLSRQVAREVILGVDDGLVALDLVDEAHGGRSSLWVSFETGLDRGIKLGTILAWILAALALILAIWLWRTSRRVRELEARSQQSEAAFTDLVRAFRGGRSEKPWMADALAMVDEALRKAGAPPRDPS